MSTMPIKRPMPDTTASMPKSSVASEANRVGPSARTVGERLIFGTPYVFRAFPQHPEEHPERPILLAVDQKLGEEFVSYSKTR
jgi:hypothetical protein